VRKRASVQSAIQKRISLKLYVINITYALIAGRDGLTLLLPQQLARFIEKEFGMFRNKLFAKDSMPTAIAKVKQGRRSYSEIYRRVDERRLLQAEPKQKNPPSKEEPYKRADLSNRDVSCFNVFL
jgi:hypothetical protein